MTVLVSQFLIAFTTLFSGTEDNQNKIESIERPFAIGEEISYKLKYGWFTIGKANVKIPSDTMVSNQKCYNVHVEARTAGVLNLFHNTVDQFDGAVAHDDLKPKFAFQDFLESGEREIQTNYYDYDKGQVIVEKSTKDGSAQEPNIYPLDPSAFDIISSYLYLRSLDGRALTPGDSIMIKSFYGKKHYDFGLEYVKKETIDIICSTFCFLRAAPFLMSEVSKFGLQPTEINCQLRLKRNLSSVR